MSDQPATTPSRSNPWRHRPKTTPIPRDEAVRQGAITQLAFQALGREQAMAFLNTDHPELGGRPLALATATAEGGARVEAEIARLAAEQAQGDL